MANTVLVQTKCTSMNVDAYKKVGVASTAIQNGTPLVLGAISSTAGQGEVFSVTAPTGIVKGLYMAYSPEVVVTADGSLQFKGLDADPRDFENVANVPFDIFYLNPNIDMIQVTAPFFASGKDPATITGATVVELNSSGAFEAKVSATSDYAGTGFSIVKSDPIVIANGALGGEAVDAWILRCTQN